MVKILYAHLATTSYPPVKTRMGGTEKLNLVKARVDEPQPRVPEMVADAFARYVTGGGLLKGYEWHKTSMCPPHRPCNLCR